MKYGAIGKNDKEEGYRSLMFLAEAYGDRETGDSTKWLETIKEGFQRFPKQDYFVGNLMDNYIRKGQIDEGLNQIDPNYAQVIRSLGYLSYNINKVISSKFFLYYLYSHTPLVFLFF